MSPVRITFTEAAEMMSKDTLRRRWQAGLFPRPIDKGAELIFDRDAVLKAAGVESAQPNEMENKNAWIKAGRAVANN